MTSKRKPHNLIPKEPVVHMNVRLPKSLHRSLKQAAHKNHSSLHAEMLLRLTLPVTRQEVADRLQQLIFEVITAKVTRDGIQAQARKAPQNGPAPQERPPQGRDG
jgi:hypothetical protein